MHIFVNINTRIHTFTQPYFPYIFTSPVRLKSKGLPTDEPDSYCWLGEQDEPDAYAGAACKAWLEDLLVAFGGLSSNIAEALEEIAARR